MGVSANPFQLAAKLDKFNTQIGKVVAKSTDVAALAAKDALLASGRAASGGDLRLSNVGRSGAKLGVSYKVTTTGQSEASAQLVARGPWQLVEQRIRPHPITSRYGGGSRASRSARVRASAPLPAGVAGPTPRSGLGGAARGDRDARAVILTPYGYRAFVRHPGTSTAKRPWAIGSAASRVIVPRVYEQALLREMVTAFGGLL